MQGRKVLNKFRDTWDMNRTERWMLQTMGTGADKSEEIQQHRGRFCIFLDRAQLWSQYKYPKLCDPSTKQEFMVSCVDAITIVSDVTIAGYCHGVQLEVTAVLLSVNQCECSNIFLVSAYSTRHNAFVTLALHPLQCLTPQTQ